MEDAVKAIRICFEILELMKLVSVAGAYNAFFTN
jgi:hypothetical protein